MKGWAAEQGHGGQGIAEMRHGLADHRATGSEAARPYCLGLLAEAYKNMAQPAEGSNVLREALEIVRCQQTKMLELRAAMSLSRLWRHTGHRQEGRQLLAGIYGWFTEGFETADLQEAAALLEELARSGGDSHRC